MDEIFEHHKDRYGVRWIYKELVNCGCNGLTWEETKRKVSLIYG